jgi:hypothetical protein
MRNRTPVHLLDRRAAADANDLTADEHRAIRRGYVIEGLAAAHPASSRRDLERVADAMLGQTTH